MSSLVDNSFDYTFQIKKNLILVRGRQSRLQDPNFKEIKIKGSFNSLDLSDKKTWKSASIDSIAYNGRDGKIKIKELEDSGSLGSLQDWDKLSDSKFGEKIFSGDDIIYSTKKHRTDHAIEGGGGDDEMLLYGGEDAEGGPGSDRFIVTQDAVKYFLRKRGAQDINISNSSLSEGDSVSINGEESDFILQDQSLSNRSITYSAKFSDINIDFQNRQPIYADFF